MIRSTPAFMLLVCGGLLLAACKKSEEAAPIPVPSGAAADTSATPVVAPPPVVVKPPPPVVTQVPPPVVRNESIDACCAALRQVGASGRGAPAKAKSAQAASVCPGIALRVRAGQTTRKDALTQIRSALVGVAPPSECM